MVLNKSRILAVLLMIIVAVLVRAEEAKEVVVASAKELKGIKAKKITWKKDGARMMLIPSTATFEQKETFDRLSKPVTKTIKVWDGPNPVSFYMHTGVKHKPK